MDSQRVINQDVQRVIKEYLQSVRESGIRVDGAFLFGSYAKGTAEKGSDIDLCIISSGYGKDYHEEMVHLRGLTHPYDYSMDVIPFHPKDLQEKYNSLAKEIRTHGIPVT